MLESYGRTVIEARGLVKDYGAFIHDLDGNNVEAVCQR